MAELKLEPVVTGSHDRAHHSRLWELGNLAGLLPSVCSSRKRWCRHPTGWGAVTAERSLGKGSAHISSQLGLLGRREYSFSAPAEGGPPTAVLAQQGTRSPHSALCPTECPGCKGGCQQGVGLLTHPGPNASSPLHP